MRDYERKRFWFLFSVLSILFLWGMVGCGGGGRGGRISKEVGVAIGPATTIGSLTEVLSPELLPVEGYGMVGGLNGTGSSECPTGVRVYLEQYILKQSAKGRIDIEKFISSADTAVVRVYGLMPTGASKHEYFDVKVTALGSTGTASLEGGWLYGVELRGSGRFGIAGNVLAEAEGPVFIDSIGGVATDKRSGYVLGGGASLEEYRVMLSLRKPDYRTASLIRNKLLERFGEETAKAVSPGMIELKVPAEYAQQRQRFVSIVKATYLFDDEEVIAARIGKLVEKLKVSKEKESSEIGLEAIGKASIGMLSELVNSSDEEVRLRAGRCLLNLGSDRGLEALRRIAMDKGSSYRIEALEAIGASARRNDAAAISRRLVRDSNFDVALAAYEQLRRLDDITVSRRLVGRSFFLEQVAQTPRKAIFVSRRGQPRIVLFGAPLHARGDIFVQYNGTTLNAPVGQGYVSIIYRHPRRRNVGPIQLRSSFDVADIIGRLGEEPVLGKDSAYKPGLGIPYADVIAILKKLCDKGGIEAEFRAGPLPKIEPIVKK